MIALKVLDKHYADRHCKDLLLVYSAPSDGALTFSMRKTDILDSEDGRRTSTHSLFLAAPLTPERGRRAIFSARINTGAWSEDNDDTKAIIRWTKPTRTDLGG